MVGYNYMVGNGANKRLELGLGYEVYGSDALIMARGEWMMCKIDTSPIDEKYRAAKGRKRSKYFYQCFPHLQLISTKY